MLLKKEVSGTGPPAESSIGMDWTASQQCKLINGLLRTFTVKLLNEKIVCIG